MERPANSRGRRRLDAFNTGRGIDRAGTANVHGGEAVAEEKAVAGKAAVAEKEAVAEEETGPDELMKELLGWAEDEELREGDSRISRSKQSECFLAYGRSAALLVWTFTPSVGKEP